MKPFQIINTISEPGDDCWNKTEVIPDIHLSLADAFKMFGFRTATIAELYTETLQLCLVEECAGSQYFRCYCSDGKIRFEHGDLKVYAVLAEPNKMERNRFKAKQNRMWTRWLNTEEEMVRE